LDLPASKWQLRNLGPVALPVTAGAAKLSHRTLARREQGIAGFRPICRAGKKGAGKRVVSRKKVDTIADTLQSESRSMNEATSQKLSAWQEFRTEFASIWSSIPYKGLFTSLLVVWVCLFEVVGNSTFGYVKTHSLYEWTFYAYLTTPDDEHGLFIPFLVLALMWWKRREMRVTGARPWLPGLSLIAFALALHLIGYFSQQARISLAAFYFGLYALGGVCWGPEALKVTFFPMCLFAFALPLGTLAETITFPLRLFATKTTGLLASGIFGINVIHRGTLIYDPTGAFSYEVAAACGGLRSLTAVLALSTIYGFMNFNGPGKRTILFLAGFPLAVVGNVTRLLMVIMVSEAFGWEIGKRVHDNEWFSLMPYVPPILGIILLGHFLGEQKRAREVKPPDFGADSKIPATT
jgi:exosortase